MKPGGLGGPGKTAALLHVRERSGIMARRGAREGELFMHDKGYYHSYTEEALMPDYPTLIPKTTTPTPETPPSSR